MDSSEPKKKKQKPVGKRAPTIPGLFPATVTSVTWPDLCDQQPQPTTRETGETSKLDIFEDSDLDNLDDITSEIEALMPTSAQTPLPSASASKTSTEASELPGTSGGIIPDAPPPPATKPTLAPPKPAQSLTPCLLTTGTTNLWDRVLQIIDFEFPDDEADFKG